MPDLVVAVAACCAAFSAAPVSAATLLYCSAADTAYRTVCDEQELRQLGGQIDDEMARLLRGKKFFH